MHRRNVPGYKYSRRKSFSGVTKESQQVELKKFVTEDSNTKMTIATKEKMPDELKSYDTLAYTSPPYILIGVIAGLFLLMLFFFY